MKLAGKRRFVLLMLVPALLAGAGVGWAVKNRMDTRANLREVDEHWQELMFGMMSYAIDRCGIYLPPDNAVNVERGAALTFDTTVPADTSVEFWHSLSTPVGYVERIYGDPFNNGAPYGYVILRLEERSPLLGLMRSYGPDGDADLDLWEFRDFAGEATARFTDTRRPYLNAEEYREIADYIRPYIYDPSNGMFSDGDVLLLFDGGGNKRFGSSGVIKELAEMNSYETLQAAAEKYLYEKDARLEIKSPENKLWHFASFLEQPKSLSPQEQQVFDSWRREAPDWWAEIEGYFQGTRSPDDLEHSFQVPVHGKCVALLTAEAITNGDFGRAERGLRTLQVFGSQKFDLDPLSYVHQKRIRREMTRLHQGLEQMILSNSDEEVEGEVEEDFHERNELSQIPQ